MARCLFTSTFWGDVRQRPLHHRSVDTIAEIPQISSLAPVLIHSLGRLTLYLPILTSRKKVAQVQIVDPLSSVWNVSTNPLLEDDGSIMLAFLNVAGDRSILDDSADGKVRLVRALTEIAGTLDDRGSLAIAMESTVSFNYKHMAGTIKSTFR